MDWRMNKMDNNINWEKLEQDAQASTSTSKYDTPQRTIFLKVKPGIHKLRILPTGNKLDSLPYMRLTQHAVRTPGEGGRTNASFMLCWNFMWENIASKKTKEEQRDNSIVGYLMKAQKMTNEDLKKFQEHGCPFCKAFAHLDMHGVEKDVKNALLPKDQWIWNVLCRATQYSGDGKCYVWGISKTHFNSVINAIRQDKASGHYTLDPDSGFDLTWNATGEGMGRRYGAPMFDRNPSPLNMMPGDIPFDLAEVMMNSYRPYQEMVNGLKLAFGKLLSTYAYIIPGDIAVANAYAGVETGRMQAQVPNVANIPGAIPMPDPTPFIPQPVAQLAAREEVGGGYYKMNGKLYDPTGKELF